MRFGFDLSPIITRFEPDRGRGSSYLVGESVRFVVSLTRAGYVALVGIDPDGVSYEFDRVFLNPGTHLLSGPPGFRYELRPPLGLQWVRAIYTDTPHPSGFVFRGTWLGSTDLHIYPAQRLEGARRGRNFFLHILNIKTNSLVSKTSQCIKNLGMEY